MIAPGDIVRYTRAWLQSVTGGDPTHSLWFRKGLVVDVDDQHGWAVVEWGDGRTYVKFENIARPGSDAAVRIDAKGWVGYGALGGKPDSPWR